MTTRLKELTVEITQQCPNRCLFCSSSSSPAATIQIEAETIISIGRQARDLGLESICLSGGEPLCHPGFPRILHGLRESGLEVCVYTSGLRLESDRVVPFEQWGELKAYNPRLIFNIPSTDPFIYGELMGGSVSRLEGALRSLSQAKRLGLSTEVHIVPNQLNLPTLEATVFDLDAMGVDKVSFLRLVMQGHARQNAERLVVPSERHEVLNSTLSDIATRSYNAVSVRLGTPFSTLLGAARSCMAGAGKLIVRYDGKALPCEAFKERDGFVLGDVTLEPLTVLLEHAERLPALSDLKRNLPACEACPAQIPV